MKESKEKINSFIKQYNFGRNFVFEYYEKALNHSEKQCVTSGDSINNISSRYLGLPTYRFEKDKCYDVGITFREYAFLYLNAFINKDSRINFVPKPLDELITVAQLDKSDEISACFWSMYAVDVCAEIIMANPNVKAKEELFPNVHSEITTFEDRFLLSLSNLLNLSKYVEKK